jgi:trans-aconitate methyltransferase
VTQLAEVKDAYGALADLYISTFGSVEKVHLDDVRFVRRWLGDRTGPVLDLGCGPGHLTGYLHGLGVDISGCDLVPAFISHARAAQPGIPFSVDSIETLNPPDHTLSGILAWYSLIHLAPADLDDVLVRLRRAMEPDGVLLVGFVPGEQLTSFQHKVIKAQMWPVELFAERLGRAGFVEVDRVSRTHDGATRPHAAIAARAS